MKFTEIISRADALESDLSNLGFIKPNVDFYVRFVGRNAAIKIEAEYHNGSVLCSPLFKDDDPEAVFDSALAWLNEQPTPDQVREQNFTKMLARTIEEGRAIGSPILADLEATMKRLSENILT